MHTEHTPQRAKGSDPWDERIRKAYKEDTKISGPRTHWVI